MRDQREMPKYKCHKEVWALKIKKIQILHICKPIDKETPGDEEGCLIITPEEKGYGPFKVNFRYANKHKPEVGGYYVVYEDGYQSYSPAKAFEDGYIRV